MPFVGLQPIIDKIPLPQILRSPLSLRAGETIDPLPCYIVSSHVTHEYVIPQEPVDSNQYVSDTIITKPVQISLDVFVYEVYAKEFFEVLQETQRSRRGFTFTDRNERTYRDLYLTNYSYDESSERIGAFEVMLELQQVIRVQVQESAAVVDVAGLAAKDSQSKGENSAQQLKTEETPPKGKLQSTLFKAKEKGEDIIETVKKGFS